MPYIPLAQRPYGFQEQFLSLGGQRLCYIEAGQGKPVLFLHGLGANVGRWQVTLQALSKDYRVLAYDHLGFGKSAKPDASYSIRYFVEALQAFVQEKKLTDFYLVGHSMGGAVALEYLASRPAEVRAAMVIAPAGIRNAYPWWKQGLARLVLPSFLAGWMMKRLITSCVHVRNHLTDEMIASAAKLPTDPEWQAFRRTTQRATLALLGYSALDRLQRIDKPVTIVWGERDTLQPAQLGLEMHRRLPSAQLVILPECGHFPMLECPEKFCDVVRHFLSDAAAPYENCEGHCH